MRRFTLNDARDFYDRFGAKQDKQAFYEDAALDALVAHGGFGETQFVFEFGCGTGRFAERLLDEVLPASAWYRGVDASRTMVTLSQQRLKRFGDRALVRLSDGWMDIETPDRQIDCIVSTYVLDLLPETTVGEFLDEAHRVLTPDGRLCVAGLTHGTTLMSKMVMAVWRTVHWIQPKWVGGCRPIRVVAMLDPEKWEVLHSETVVAWGMPSEVLVARPR